MTTRALLTISLLALAIPAVGQTFRGGINGTVNDPSGAAVSGATVQAVNPAMGLRRDTVTSAAGDFTFPDLPLGDYQVTITQSGFDKVLVEKVAVEVGKVTGLRLALKVASQSQAVDVETSGVVIDTETSTTNAVIPNKAVQDMPLNGRDFTQLVKLAPGVNGAGSINGARTMQNNWQIDGADNNDAWHNAVAVNQGGVSGVAGTLLPIDAIDQFSVQTNANAEAGRNGGGSINMVIKSGGNAIHGSL
ncbi:MAG: TonB-dependent receptor plug, partial [Bryobacterales bacterium]|nr:TonB-dependent receptor plug [Bryobacterales bacterium]